MERSTISQVCQLGVEATPGTPVAATRKLSTMKIEAGVRVDVKTYRPSGYKFITVAAKGKESTGAKLSGPATFTEVVYPLSGILCAPTITTPVGATDARKWAWTPNSSGEDAVKTFTIEEGSAARAHRFGYGLMTDFGLKWSRDSMDLSGSMIGRRLEDGVALSAGATGLELIPVLADGVDVYLDPTAAGLGTTKLLRHISGSFDLNNRFGPLWTVNSAEDSFTAHVELEPKAEVKLLLAADAQGMALLETLRQGDTRYLRVEATGGQIEAGQNYGLTLDMAVKVTNISDFSDSDGLYAAEFTFELAHDESWGKALTVEVVNKLAAL